MKDIRINHVLANKRRNKGLTQEDLANVIGVTKASVSKWETGQSYPDITLLPKLAVFFGISIDELIGYEPQLSKGAIQNHYSTLSIAFTEEPFETVLERIRALVKAYYTCYPLVLRMAELLVNHSILAETPHAQQAVFEEAKAGCVRVRLESNDAALINRALGMEAICELSVGNAARVQELLSGSMDGACQTTTLLARAYQMQGAMVEAQETLQIGVFQNVVQLLQDLTMLMNLSSDDQTRYIEIKKRLLDLSDTFDIRHLHPGILSGVYVSIAMMEMQFGEKAAALKALDAYAALVTGPMYPLQLQADAFFNRIDDWLQAEAAPPRDDATVRTSSLAAVEGNPAFASLTEDAQFKGIVRRLAQNLA